MPILANPTDATPTLATGDQGGVGGYMTGFSRSMLESLPELVGIDPSDETLQWRQQNPLGGFVSQMATPIGEFGLAAKLGTQAARSLKWLSALEESSPVIGGVVKGALGMGGIDAARIAGSVLAGGDTRNVVQSSIIDTAMQAGFGGAGGLLQKFGSGVKPEFDWGSSDSMAPLQVRARELQTRLASGGIPEAQQQAAKDQLDTWAQQIKAESVPGQARPVRGFMTRPMTDTLGDMATPIVSDNKQLNRLFGIQKPGAPEPTVPGAPAEPADITAGPATIKRKLVQGAQGFTAQEDLAKVTADANLPDGYEFQGQNFRHISFSNQQAAATVNKIVKNNMLDVGDGWYLAKEQNPKLLDGQVTDSGGLYVMAKKITGPVKVRAGAPLGNAADQWLIFKTDSPGFFKPAEDRFNQIVDKTAWDPAQSEEYMKGIQSQRYFQFADQAKQNIPIQTFQSGKQGILGMGPKWAPSSWADSVAQLFAKAQGWGDSGYALQNAKNFANEYFAPAMYQFANNPLARRMYTTMRMLFDQGEASTLSTMHGDVGPLEGNLWKHMVSGGQRQGGIANMIRDLSDTDWATYQKVLDEQKYRVMTPEQLQASLAVSPDVAKLHGAIQGMDERNWINTAKAMRLAGDEDTLGHLAGHMSLSRTWEGDFRVPVYDEKGDMISMGSGTNRGAAQKSAKNLVAEAQAQGKKWSTNVDDVKLNDVWDDMAATKQFKTRSAEDWRVIDAANIKSRPGFMKERKGIGGYEGEGGFTRQQLIEKLTKHDAAMQKMQAAAAYNTIFDTDRQALAQSASGVGRQLDERLHQLMGHQGPFGKWLNTSVDRLLAPALGKNSASKIVNATGRALYGLRLGMGNLSLPIMNALNFTQTLLPEMAFLSGGAPESIAKYYSHQLAIDASGKLVGKTSTLNLFKMMGQGLRQLGSPDPEFRSLFQKFLNDGTVDPRIAKEFIGDKATLKQNLKTVLRGGESRGAAFANFIEQVGNWPAEMTERFSRAHAIATGYNYGKDVLGLEGPGLEQFVRQFADRTMFRFGTADRSKVFAGPLGSGMGLFKNWMMHYLWNVMRYAGEATRGNFKPLMLAAALPAMAGGLPATGGLWYLGDKISRIWNNKSLMDRIYESFGADNPDDANPADLLYQGLPGYLPKLLGLPGVSLTQSLAMPMGDPGSEITWMATPAIWDQAKLAGKAIQATRMGQAATGGMTPDAWTQMARAFLPKIFYRGMNAAQDGMINSASTLEPEMTNLSPMERFYYMMGINPDKVALYYDIKNELTQEQTDKKALTSKMGQEWAIAEDSGNSALMQRVVKRALAAGVDITKVLNSAKGYSRRFGENGLSNNLDKVRASSLQRLTGVNIPSMGDVTQ